MRFSRSPPSSWSSRRSTDEIQSLTPVELVVKTLDVGIAACGRGDRAKASRAVVELIGALNFEYREMSASFFRLYDYCLRCVRAGDFETAARVLKELRDSWAQAPAAHMNRAG